MATVSCVTFHLPDTGLVDVALAQRRKQAHIQIQTGPIGQRVGNDWLGRFSGQACWQRYRRNRHVNCSRTSATGQQRQQAHDLKHNHHPQQPL